jgi:pimeloyl-ACP methyl ester carboxylesterase
VEAVVAALALDKVVPVGHDAGGPAAVNFALRHPERTATVVLMNVFYGQAPGLLVPELIELFSYKPLAPLARHFLTSPQQLAWLIEFQRELMLGDAAPARMARYRDLLGPLIDQNFRQQPSAAPAFAQMTTQLADEIAANTGCLIKLRRSSVPFVLIWGRNDPYLHVSFRRVPTLAVPARRAPCCWKRDTGRRSTPPRRLHGSCWGRERSQPAIAASSIHRGRSPRRLRPASYCGQFWTR